MHESDGQEMNRGRAVGAGDREPAGPAMRVDDVYRAFCALSRRWLGAALLLESEALDAQQAAVAAEFRAEAPHADSASALSLAAIKLREAGEIRRRHSDLIRVLEFLGISIAFVALLFVGGCAAPVGGETIEEACSQYDAETADAPCRYACPWDGEGTCDAERVSECASAVLTSCETSTPAECADACEVRR